VRHNNKQTSGDTASRVCKFGNNGNERKNWELTLVIIQKLCTKQHIALPEKIRKKIINYVKYKYWEKNMSGL
jgi:hypothetical protein